MHVRILYISPDYKNSENEYFYPDIWYEMGNKSPENSENLIFTYAIQKILNNSQTKVTMGSFKDWFKVTGKKLDFDFINTNFDCIVTTPGTKFSTDQQEALEALSQKLENIRIPFYVISIGVRLSFDQKVSDFPKKTQEIFSNFIKSVYKTGGKFGLRGNKTSELFELLGFKNYTVIGCPSLYLLNSNINIQKQNFSKKELNPIFNLSAKNILNDSFIIPFTKEYPNSLIVSQGEFYNLFYGDINSLTEEDKNILKNPNNLFLDLLEKDRIRLYKNFPHWLKDIEKGRWNFSLGDSLYGNIASLLAGIPCFIYANNWEAQELAEFFYIPYKKYMTEEEDPFLIYQKLDYSLFNQMLPKNLRVFKNFLRECNLPNSLDSEGHLETLKENNIIPSVNLKKIESLKRISSSLKEYDLIEFPKPFFEENNIAITLSTDKNYLPYLSVVIQSIIDTSSSYNNYDLLILYESFNKSLIPLLEEQISHLNNFSIRFLNVSSLFKNISLHEKDYFTKATYYRLKVASIFQNYSKIVYLDIDTLVRKDIATLYNKNIEDKYLGIAIDHPIPYLLLKNPIREKAYQGSWLSYCTEYLQLEDPFKYFNAGVILWNIDLIKKDPSIEANLLKLANSKRYFFLLDQDILNLFFNSKPMLFLEPEWNYYFKFPSSKKPNIIHYIGAIKPWGIREESTYEDQLWWNTAIKTPMYQIILQRHLKEKNSFKNIIKRIFPENSKRGKLLRKLKHKLFL